MRGVFSTRDDLDLSNAQHVSEWMDRHQPHVLINTAAYTAVDRAEEEPETARLGNTIVPETLAAVCAQKGIPLIHISTDYVFDGKGKRPYQEDDPVNPQSVYGKTKLDGERAVLKASPQNLVIRTSWLYSEYGHNFVKTMLRLGAEKASINVVNDQLGNPTYAGDLARTLVTVVDQMASDKRSSGGVYHYTNGGIASWYDLASAVMRQRGLPCAVKPCTSAEFPTKAQRPAFSALDTQKIRTTFGLEIPDWKDALKRALAQIPAS